MNLAGFVARVVEHGRRSLSRSSVAPHTRPVRGAALGGDAAADAGPARRAEVRGVARGVPHARRAGGRAARAVLRAWQGLGYNRRAIALKRTAEEVAERFGGGFPPTRPQLRSLPGIGPATAAGVRAFALRAAGVYLETNVRTVFLHELFADRDGVTDREIGRWSPPPSTRRRARESSPRDVVLRAARLRRAAQARAAQPVAAQRAPHAAVALRGHRAARSGRGCCAR